MQFEADAARDDAKLMELAYEDPTAPWKAFQAARDDARLMELASEDIPRRAFQPGIGPPSIGSPRQPAAWSSTMGSPRQPPKFPPTIDSVATTPRSRPRSPKSPLSRPLSPQFSKASGVG